MINNQKNKFLKATIFIIFIVLIGLAIFWKKPIIKIFFNEDKKLNTSLPYARAMLSRVYGTNKPFSGRSPEEIYGYAPNYSKIQIVPIGRSAKINKIEPNFLEKGKFVILRQLKPEASSSDFVITGTPNFFIFGLEGKIAK